MMLGMEAYDMASADVDFPLEMAHKVMRAYWKGHEPSPLNDHISFDADGLITFARAVATAQREVDAPYMQHTRKCIENMEASKELPDCTCGLMVVRRSIVGKAAI